MHDQHSNLRALCFALRRQMEDTLNPAAPKCNAQLQALQDLIERTEDNGTITGALLNVDLIATRRVVKAKAENDGETACDNRTNSEIADDIYGELLDAANPNALEGHLEWLLRWLDDHESESKGRMIVQAVFPAYQPIENYED